MTPPRCAMELQGLQRGQVVGRLCDLAELHTSGLLSTEEYGEAKRNLLAPFVTPRSSRAAGGVGGGFRGGPQLPLPAGHPANAPRGGAQPAAAGAGPSPGGGGVASGSPARKSLPPALNLATFITATSPSPPREQRAARSGRRVDAG